MEIIKITPPAVQASALPIQYAVIKPAFSYEGQPSLGVIVSIINGSNSPVGGSVKHFKMLMADFEKINVEPAIIGNKEYIELGKTIQENLNALVLAIRQDMDVEDLSNKTRDMLQGTEINLQILEGILLGTKEAAQRKFARHGAYQPEIKCSFKIYDLPTLEKLAADAESKLKITSEKIDAFAKAVKKELNINVKCTKEIPKAGLKRQYETLNLNQKSYHFQFKVYSMLLSHLVKQEANMVEFSPNLIQAAADAIDMNIIFDDGETYTEIKPSRVQNKAVNLPLQGNPPPAPQ